MKTKIRCVAFLVALFFIGCQTATLPVIPTIDFTNDELTALEIIIPEEQKTFTILQFADTQMSTFEELEKVKALINKLMKNSDPDLIVLTGDNTAGKMGTEILHHFIEFLDTLNTPYAPSFGNHDPESDSLETLGKIWKEGKNALFKLGPIEKIQGVGNYAINIIQNDTIKHSVYMIDSNQYRTYSIKDKIQSQWGGLKYDYLYPSQIAWYAASVNYQNELANRIIPSTAYFHIAIPEYRAIELAKKEAIIIPQNSFQIDPIRSPIINTGMFSKMQELGSTKATFVGHDHYNNFVFKYQGIILGYGLKTGRTSYHDTNIQGATEVTLIKDFTSYDIKQLWEKDL